MREKLVLPLLLGLSLCLAGCETTGQRTAIQQETWPTLETIDNREIIVRLEQTVTTTPKRDKQAEEVIQTMGYIQEPTPELIEDFVVQAIEVQAVTTALEDIYGQDFQREGVTFLDNPSFGASRTALWVGIKNPDERFEKLVKTLQAQVDDGRILADLILFFRSKQTLEEQDKILEDVSNTLQPLVPKNASFAASVDVKTGIIHIEHDFLKKEDQQKIKATFSKETFAFKQNGRLAPASGESMYQYPKEIYTATPLTEGGYIHAIEVGRILVAGGGEDAVYYAISEPKHPLRVGQRVKVEYTGMILTSFPGQGTAKYIEVLPDYKPTHATLTESEAIIKILEKAQEKSDAITIITSLSYHSKTDQWRATVQQNDKEYAIEI